MSGNKIGARKTAETIRRKYGNSFFKTIGAMGGRVGRTGGFFDRDLARRAGYIGGKISRRGKKLSQEERLKILKGKRP